MGAEFDCVHYKPSSKATVKKLWKQAVKDDLYDNGHSYSGSIGMLGGDIDWRPEKFGTADEAEAFLAETHEKWEPPLAVELEGGGWVVGGWCSS
jgi:hypothetical protein